MSILTRKQLFKAYKNKKIFIKPFNKQNVGTNSIDVTLSKHLITYEPIEIVWSKRFLSYIVQRIAPLKFLDIKKSNKTYKTKIPKDGLILLPGILYLGSTIEAAGSEYYVPMYDGRSSMARLGIQSHISAGFGDIGFQSNWTLEIIVVHPTKIYRNIRIGQVFFHEPTDQLKKKNLYHGKYTKQSKPQASKSYKDYLI